MSDQRRGVVVERRIGLFPDSISPEARAAHERLVRADGVPLNGLHVMSPPEDHDAWRSVKAAADAHHGAAVKGLAGSLRSSVEPIRAGEATIQIGRQLRGEPVGERRPLG